MNQILYTANGKISGPLPINTVVRFFSICIILLGIIFLVEGTYGIFYVDFGESAGLDTTVPDIEFSRDRKYRNYFGYT